MFKYRIRQARVFSAGALLAWSFTLARQQVAKCPTRWPNPRRLQAGERSTEPWVVKGKTSPALFAGTAFPEATSGWYAVKSS
jgi:hypothetical protein